MHFVWSLNKAEENRRKHRVTFDEARTCFSDTLQIAFYDPDHSECEDRDLMIGHSSRGRLLIVSYTLRGSAVRLISARKTTPTEALWYAQRI